ncbi:hypothetical protein CTI12_AA358450 [Artemisia annua]|uniref:Uncharacterized protein n=1 Tax=Artemisia annua TaxID=35608 RepID=A0A2U1MNL2_ARTAN|nr:hypothetical protein CTI12_AA358450 [Artemisia annua]
MERKTITVCIIVVVLGVAAAIAGFAAESTKVKRSQITVVYVGYIPDCEYPSSPSMGLALAATVAIVLARAVITSATGGCCSCCQSISLSILARICIVISWITSFVAIVLFLQGARLSSMRGAERGIDAKRGAAKTSEVDLELEAPSTMDGKKPPITDAMKPPITDAMKPPVPMQKH